MNKAPRIKDIDENLKNLGDALATMEEARKKLTKSPEDAEKGKAIAGMIELYESMIKKATFYRNFWVNNKDS